MQRSNEEIRRAIGANGLKQWQVAEALGMGEGNFSRKLRTELKEKEKAEILSVINSMTNGQGGDK